MRIVREFIMPDGSPTVLIYRVSDGYFVDSMFGDSTYCGTFADKATAVDVAQAYHNRAMRKANA